MVSAIPAHTSSINTPSLSLALETHSFEQKLQAHLILFAKSMLKDSIHDIWALSQKLLSPWYEQPNSPFSLAIGISNTLHWQAEILSVVFKELSENGRTNIDESFFRPGPIGSLVFSMELLFIELIKNNTQTQLLNSHGLKAATYISRGCMSKRAEAASQILLKTSHLSKSLKTISSGVNWALQVISLYKKMGVAQQEFLCDPFVPIDDNSKPGPLTKKWLIDPKILYQTLIDTIGGSPRSVELQSLLHFSAAATLWMTVYDEVIWVIQRQWVSLGSKGSITTDAYLQFDLYLGTLAWQILEQYHRYSTVGATTLRNLILSELGYPNGSLEEYTEISHIPLESICAGFHPEHKKYLIELIRKAPERFWDTGNIRESLIWHFREDPTQIERGFSLLKQLPFKNISNSELIRMLELRVSGRQAQQIRTTSDVARVLTHTGEEPNLSLVPVAKTASSITEIIVKPLLGTPPPKSNSLSSTLSPISPIERQEERLKQLSEKYHLFGFYKPQKVLDTGIIDACFTYAKRAHTLFGWKPQNYAQALNQAFSDMSQEPLINYYTALAIQNILRELPTQSHEDEITRKILISNDAWKINERVLFITSRIYHFLKAIDPGVTSSTHSNNPIGTGGISDKLSERIRTVLPIPFEWDRQFLKRTLQFQWMDDGNRATLKSHWDKRGIQTMRALENKAIGIFASIEILTQLPNFLSMSNGRVDGGWVSKIVGQLLREWVRISQRESSQK